MKKMLTFDKHAAWGSFGISFVTNEVSCGYKLEPGRPEHHLDELFFENTLIFAGCTCICLVKSVKNGVLWPLVLAEICRSHNNDKVNKKKNDEVNKKKNEDPVVNGSLHPRHTGYLKDTVRHHFTML